MQDLAPLYASPWCDNEKCDAPLIPISLPFKALSLWCMEISRDILGMALVLIIVITLVIIHHRWFPVNSFCLKPSLLPSERGSIISLTASPPFPLLMLHQRDRYQTSQSGSLHNSCLSDFYLLTFLIYVLKYFLDFIFRDFFFFLTLGSCGGLKICAQILCYSSLPSGVEPNSSPLDCELDLGAGF